MLTEPYPCLLVECQRCCKLLFLELGVGCSFVKSRVKGEDDAQALPNFKVNETVDELQEQQLRTIPAPRNTMAKIKNVHVIKFWNTKDRNNCIIL